MASVKTIRRARRAVAASALTGAVVAGAGVSASTPAHAVLASSMAGSMVGYSPTNAGWVRPVYTGTPITSGQVGALVQLRITPTTGTATMLCNATVAVTLVSPAGRSTAVTPRSKACTTSSLAVTVVATSASVGSAFRLDARMLPNATKAVFPITGTQTVRTTVTHASGSAKRAASLDAQFNGTDVGPQFQVNGPWPGTDGNTMDPSNVGVNSGTMWLNSSPKPATWRSSADNAQLHGGEVQSKALYASGYFEARLKTSCVPGAVQTFWISSADAHRQLAQPEADWEMLTKAPTQGWPVIHVNKVTTAEQAYALPSSACAAFHTYGILVQPNTLSFYVDRKLVRRQSALGVTLGGPSPMRFFVLANTWAGNAGGWSGAPNTKDASAYYDWIRAWPGVTVPMFS